MKKRNFNFIKAFAMASTLLFMLVATASPLLAAITISGTVTDSGDTPAPIANAYVGLYTDCFSTYSNGTMTDASGNYSFTDIPDGTYFVAVTDNPDPCLQNYVAEFWNDSDMEPHTCDNATPVSTTRADVNFSLQPGYQISGTVYAPDGTTPVPGVFVALHFGDACDGYWLTGIQADQSGQYCFTVPTGGPYFVSAEPQGMDYAPAWYRSSIGPGMFGEFCCDYAEAINIIDADVSGANFYLADGGSISGVIKDSSGAPIANVPVNIGSDGLEIGWNWIHTGPDGSFQFTGLAPGIWSVHVQPDVTSGYAQLIRDYYLENIGEDRNIGTLILEDGALITGTFTNPTGAPIPDIEFEWGGKFEGGESETETGYFEIRLPLGTHSLTVEDDQDDGVYCMLPEHITVTDTSVPQSLGNVTLYDPATGATITGTVTDNGLPYEGGLQVVAFDHGQEFTPDKAGGVIPLGFGMPDGSGNYALLVPPSATIDLYLVAGWENECEGAESVVVVDALTNITTPTAGQTLTGQNMEYTSVGGEIGGIIADRNDPMAAICRANAILYSQPGDVFAGFAMSNGWGDYYFFNAPAGDYRIAVIHPDYPDEITWSEVFTLNESDWLWFELYLGEEAAANLINWNGNLVADFGNNGLWYHDGIQWNWMSNSGHVGQMVVWDGKLVVDFGPDYGLHCYDGTSWTWMSNKGGVNFMTVWNNGSTEKLVVDFGGGRRIYTYNGTWSWFNNKDDVNLMTVWNNRLVVDFGAGRGVYNYDTSWHWMSNKDDVAMAVVWNDGFTEYLVVDFGGGRRVYTYNGTWSWLSNKDDVNAMEVWNGKLVVDFGSGRSMYNYDTSWHWMTNKDDVAQMVTWSDSVGDKLAVDFGGGRGMSYYDGAWNWMKNASDVSEMIAWEGTTLWGELLAVDFGPGTGVYYYDDSWNFMKSWSTAD